MNSVSTKDQWKMWSRVALHSFGGPAGQIATIHQVMVVEKKLISEERFLHALNFCMLLPGPEAMQLATYMGWLMNKWKGGLLAGGLFILPGFLSIMLLSYLYILYIKIWWVQGIFYGLKPAIIAIILSALYRISTKSLKSSFHWTVAGLSFIALFALNTPFPVVVFSSGIIGSIAGRYFLKDQPQNDILGPSSSPSLAETGKTVIIWLGVWTCPIMATLFVFGVDSTFHRINLFFSKMSLVTFGGAYAALTYVSQEAVHSFHWLQTNEMLDGLAMAETTPGPLIQVVQFVGFMGSYRLPDMDSPYLAAFIGSCLATWMTFAPCFLWIFAGAPYVELLRQRKSLNHGLSSISAAVVGVLFNLGLVLILKTIWPQSGQMDTKALTICLVAIALKVVLKRGSLIILLTCATLGILLAPTTL